jgi:hypothetical protein
LNKRHFLLFLSAFFFMTNGLQAGTASSAVANGLNDLTRYPRVEQYERGSVQVDFPTVENWPDFQWLNAWLPVEVRLHGDATAYVGSALVRAFTHVDLEKRTVRISSLSVEKTNFSQDQVPGIVDDLVAKAFQGRESIIPLDVVLRLLPEDFEIPGDDMVVSGLNFEAPHILVSNEPVKLLAIDKKPVTFPVEGTEIEWVVNTNWSVFHYKPENKWYVLNDETWQANNFLSGGDWDDVGELPPDFQKMAQDEAWSALRGVIPPRKPQEQPSKFIVTLQATELILLDGPPQLANIEGTDIRYVTNTESDLLSYAGDWYYLVSGRWFKNRELQGNWTPVKTLPAVFSEIPAKHKMGHVLFSVPGTRQARLALIEASIPNRVSIPADAGSELEVPWVGEPRFESIDMTSLQRGVNTPFQVIRHNNFYYLCYEGAWYLSDSPLGGWKTALTIPEDIYRIPASDPAYNVTFVRLEPADDPAQTGVTYRSSSGYRGSYSTGAGVVYGTGWNYPGQVYWDASHGPAYWRHWWTYGYNMGYYPVGGLYRPRYPYYNGWYGWSAYRPMTTMSIKSPAVDYQHGHGSAWEGPLQTTPGIKSDTGSLDRFLPKDNHVDGTESFTRVTEEETAAASKVSAVSLYASTSLSSSRFSGRDGEVYKKEGEEWRHYREGDWREVSETQRNAVLPSSSDKSKSGQAEPWLPAHKRVLSRSELDEQALSRLEGMDNYAKYRMEKDFKQ